MITAEGRLTASQAGQLHSALLEAFNGSRRVELALRDVHEADLSLLQLLYSAQRTAAARAIVFTLSGLESADPVRRLITAAGAETEIGCRGGCPWPEAGTAAVDSGGNASG